MRISHAVMMISLLTAAAWPAHAVNVDAKAELPAQTRQLARHQVDMQRLQHDVARQEADSERASERLRQQDKVIAELQRRLQALETPAAPARH